MDYTRVARKITLVLFLSQGLSSAGFIAAFTVNALVAVDLTGRTAMAGVPGALYVLGQACGAVVWGISMERFGRRRALAFGQVIGVVGSAIATAAVVERSFIFFLIGLLLVGVARSAVDLGRFAAAEVHLPAERGRAISKVVLGSTVGAIFGPLLVGPTGQMALGAGFAELAGPEIQKKVKSVINLFHHDGYRMSAAPAVVMSQDGIEGLWKLRKQILWLIEHPQPGLRALAVINDVGVPVDRLAEFIYDVQKVFARHGTLTLVYGHAGNGNLHLRPLFDLSLPDIRGRVRQLADDVYDVVLGSRILGGTARKGGMPLYKYFFNRFLTAFQNLFLGAKLSEYHTGFRAFSRKVLMELPLLENSDDFVFDNEMLAQSVYAEFRIGEVSCPTKYFPEASSINFRRSVVYGIGVISTTLKFALERWGVGHFRLFSPHGRKLGLRYYEASECSASASQLP